MTLPSELADVVREQPYPLLFVTISGAHLYGFPSSDSDYDLRGVHILSNEAVLGLYPTEETIDQSFLRNELEIDIVTHEVKKFFGLLLKRNGYVLEQLFSPLILHTTMEHEQLRHIAKDCITRNHAHHYLGFSKTQWRLFAKESPPRIKPLLYVLRTLLTGIHLMRTGEVEANLNHLNETFGLPYVPDLIEQKTLGREGETLVSDDLAFYEAEYQRLTVELETARDKSSLPDKANCKSALNTLLLEIRL